MVLASIRSSFQQEKGDAIAKAGKNCKKITGGSSEGREAGFPHWSQLADNTNFQSGNQAGAGY